MLHVMSMIIVIYSLLCYPFSMPSEKPQILIVVDEDLFKEIEDFRFDNRIQSRSEAVRLLIKEGLRSEQLNSPKDQKKKK